MNKDERRLKLRDVIKVIRQNHRAEMPTPTLMLTLLTYPLAGTSKAKTLEYGTELAAKYFKKSREYVPAFFQHWRINLADGESFSEKEVQAAEYAVICLIHEFFKDEFDAAEWLMEYDIEGKQTPFCNIHIHNVDAPKSKPAEMKFVPADKAAEFFAKYYPNFTNEEMRDFLNDFCTHYESNGESFYDFAELVRFNEIIGDECHEPLLLLTGDKTIDEFLLFLFDLCHIELDFKE